MDYLELDELPLDQPISHVSEVIRVEEGMYEVIFTYADFTPGNPQGSYSQAFVAEPPHGTDAQARFQAEHYRALLLNTMAKKIPVTMAVVMVFFDQALQQELPPPGAKLH